MIELRDVYHWIEMKPGSHSGALPWITWRILKEREPHESISHKAMPTLEQHVAFILSRPYEHWYEILAPHPDGGGRTSVGAIYLSKQREIGIGIAREYRRRGFAVSAIKELMRLHPGERFLANINPANEASIALFRSLGFGGPIQITLEKS